jgi:hypothetical protein
MLLSAIKFLVQYSIKYAGQKKSAIANGLFLRKARLMSNWGVSQELAQNWWRIVEAIHESYLLSTARCRKKYAPILSAICVAWLIGDWSLVREWGRAGSPGTVRKDWFDAEYEAITAGEKLRIIKKKKGYQSIL